MQPPVILQSMTESTKPLITLSNIIGPTDRIICEPSSFVCNGLTVQCWVYYNPNAVQKPPIVVIHGGPGFTHNYLLPLKLLAEFGYPVVFYDQAGCGDSTFVADPDTDAPWLLTIEYYVKELSALVHHFQLYEYYLYGSSWGTVVAQVTHMECDVLPPLTDIMYACRNSQYPLRPVPMPCSEAFLVLFLTALYVMVNYTFKRSGEIASRSSPASRRTCSRS